MKWQTKGILFLSLSSFLFLVLLACLIASCVLGDFLGSTPIFEGDCNVAGPVNSSVHVVIATLSTLVMLSTDFFVRLAAAPQRDDIKASHQEARWMEVGVNSIRNLKYMPPLRAGLWILGILTSIPLQLFFNATVFSTTTSTNYNQLLVGKGFLEGQTFALPGVAKLEGGGEWKDDRVVLEPMFQAFQRNVSGFYWTRLDGIACRQTYLQSRNGLQFYRHLVIVVEVGPDANAPGWTDAEVWSGTLPTFFNGTSTTGYRPNATNSLWSYSPGCGVGDNLGSTFNVCSGDFGYDEEYITDDGSLTFSEPWQYPWIESQFGATIQDDLQYFPNFNLSYDTITALYCLAEPFVSPCKVEVTNQLLFVVCLFILLKCLFSLATLLLLWHSKPIQCLGDAIQFFLEEEEADQATLGLCTYNQDDFRRQNTQPNPSALCSKWNGRPRPWSGSTKRRGSAVPRRVWLETYAPILAVLIIAISLLVIGINHNSYGGGGTFYEAGFGANPNNNHLHFTGGSVKMSLVANLPQLVLSACYFMFSSLYSALFQARDWAHFTKDPQRLKVTVPEVDQDSTYLLQIPFVWGAIFTFISAALHWLVSQSLFVIASEVLPAYIGDDLAQPLTFEVAFSTRALLATLIAALVALSIPLALSAISLPKGSIIVGTNSAAISAQCHRARPQPRADREGDAAGPEDAGAPFLQPFDNLDPNQHLWQQRLKWGVLVPGSTDAERPGHLGLGIGWGIEGEPKEGDYYA